jgi:hypothetical protein
MIPPSFSRNQMNIPIDPPCSVTFATSIRLSIPANAPLSGKLFTLRARNLPDLSREQVLTVTASPCPLQHYGDGHLNTTGYNWSSAYGVGSNIRGTILNASFPTTENSLSAPEQSDEVCTITLSAPEISVEIEDGCPITAETLTTQTTPGGADTVLIPGQPGVTPRWLDIDACVEESWNGGTLELLLLLPDNTVRRVAQINPRDFTGPLEITPLDCDLHAEYPGASLIARTEGDVGSGSPVQIRIV